MIHLRIVSPAERTAQVLTALDTVPHVVNVVVLPGAARRPTGDVVLVDVPNETANHVVTLLRARGIDREGSIAVERSATFLSSAAARAADAAPGHSSEAVVWSEVDARAADEATLTASFVAMLALATAIAAVGILTDSIALVIGAMVIGPEYGPLVAVAYGLFRRRPRQAAAAARTLLAALAVSLVVTFLLALVVRGLDANPRAYSAGVRPLTQFISHPDGWSVVVAVLAAVAGTLSLTQVRANALIGVFISVTTVPAAANLAVAAANGNRAEARGAFAQLALNLAVIVAAATLTFLAEWLLERALRRRLRARRQPLP